MQASFTIKTPYAAPRSDGRLPTVSVISEESTGQVSLQVGTPDDRFGPEPVATTTVILGKSEARAIASALMGAAAEL